MSEDPGNRFDRWKVDLVGAFFGVQPDQAEKATKDSQDKGVEHAEDGQEEFKIEVAFVDAEDPSVQDRLHQAEAVDKEHVTGLEAFKEQIREDQSKDFIPEEGVVEDFAVIDHLKLENDTLADRGRHLSVEGWEGLENSFKEEKVKIQAFKQEIIEVDEEVKASPNLFPEVEEGFLKSENVDKILLLEESIDESSFKDREDDIKVEIMGPLKIENSGNNLSCEEFQSGEKQSDEWKDFHKEIFDTNPAVMQEIIDVATEEADICKAVSDIILEMETKEDYEAAPLPGETEVATPVEYLSTQAGQQFDIENSSDESEDVESPSSSLRTELVGYEQEEVKVKQEVKQVVEVKVETVENVEEESVETMEGNAMGKVQDVVATKTSCKVIDIGDSQESDDECEEDDLPIVSEREAVEAAEMIIYLILGAVSYEAVHPGIVQDDPPISIEIASVPTLACMDKPKFCVSEDVAISTCIHPDDATTNSIQIKAVDNAEVIVAPIDASKVSFACMDVRLKTGFPAKVELKVKNCVSIILSGPEKGELLKKLGSLGCAAGLKFYSQSRVMNGQVRKDLVFKYERDAAKFYKSIQSNRSVKSFLHTESELGFGSIPVLSESELMHIMTMNVGEKNFMKMFDGRVEEDREGMIQFKFSSLASLNLFLFHTGGPDSNNTALGMLRSSFKDEKSLVLQGVYHRKRKCDEFRLNVVHPPAPHKKPYWKFGWNWVLLEKTCNFKIVSGSARTSSLSRKVLVFNNKLSLYEFWSSITAKLFSEVKILDFKLKEFVPFIRQLDRNIQFVENEVEIEKYDALQEREADLNEVEGNVDYVDTRLEEVNSCKKDNLFKESREVGSRKQEILMSDKVIQEEILARKALEKEIKTLKLETDKLKEDLKTAITRMEVLGTEVKDKSETIASLEERLVTERKAVINLSDKLSHHEMERKIEEEIARRTLENQINNLADYDCRQDDYYNDRRNLAMRNLSGNGKRSSQVSRPLSGPPQISWTNILSLTWRRESEGGGNYTTCLWNFLRDVSTSLESVFKIGEEIILKFKSSEKLDRIMRNFVTDEGRNFRKLDDLEQRARLVPDELRGTYGLTIVYTEENFHLQSKKQLLEELKKADGYLFCRDGSVFVSFPTVIAYVRALVSRKLWVYHRVFLVREQFELIGGNGEDNYFKGQVCLTELNLLSLYFKGEEEIGFAECFSDFLKNRRIVNVDLGRNDRLVVTFYSLIELEECLKDYCQANCNTLAKLIKLPVRCKLIVRKGSYSLLCPSTAVKKDFIGYQNLCRLEAQPRRISSKSKLCLVQILRDLEKQRKYPEIHFSEDNFYWKIKRGPTKPREVVAVHVLDESQDNAVVHGPPVEGREITSDYEESVYSEAAGGLDGRH